MFPSSQRRDGSEETTGGREIKEEELERKRAGEENGTGVDGERQTRRRGGKEPNRGSGEEKEGRDTACCVF